MMKVSLLAIILGVVASAPPKAHQLDGYTFNKYKEDFGKLYADAEHSMREGIFSANLAKIRAHNAGQHTWKMGVNKFTDMTEAELLAFKGYAGSHSLGDDMVSDPPEEFFQNLKSVEDLPRQVDWRDQGVVTPVKDQGGCGSCWAFSAIATMESHVAVATGSLLELSTQQIVSCTPNPHECGGGGGCTGSTQWLAFKYSIRAGGVSTEEKYPYKGITGVCRPRRVKKTQAAGIKGYVRLPTNNYTMLMNAVATLGPIAISVDASWYSYESGVYTNGCGTTIDHAVVLDGYGIEDGVKYYLVRNSWGEGWGDSGYIKIARHNDDSTECGTDTNPGAGTKCKPYPATQKVCGLCGILSDSVYPTGAYLIDQAEEA